MATMATGEINSSFYDELAAASSSYAALKQEKEIHAEKKISQKVQAQRREYFASHSRSKNGIITPSPLPYARHYAKILPKVSPMFRNKELHFVDVGSAPGGLCRFLCKELQWSGRAFSLSDKRDGFRMMYRGGERLKFERCDVSKPRAWQTLLDKLEELKEDGEFLTFDFVNLGVTLQWQPPPLSPPEETQVPSTTTSPNQKESLTSSSSLSQERNNHITAKDPPVRNHRLTLQETLRNELLFALKTLKQGGSLMIALPTSDHPNTFLYLSYLRKIAKKLSILPTPKLNRNPVYVLAHQIDIESEGVSSFVAFLESTDITPENDSKWSIAGWDEARPIFEECKADFEKLWKAQCREIKKERLTME